MPDAFDEDGSDAATRIICTHCGAVLPAPPALLTYCACGARLDGDAVLALRFGATITVRPDEPHRKPRKPRGR